MSLADTKRKRRAKWHIDLAIHDALAMARNRSVDQAFQRLLAIVRSRSELLRPGAIGGHAAWNHARGVLHGLVALARHHKSWLRESVDWEPYAGGPREQFGSLARHLLANHPVPNFMTRVWFDEPSETVTRHQKLYKHLGLGNNVRGADVPLRLSKLMARFFMQAADHLTVEQALRFGQVRGLGGNKPFASAVISTRLGSVFAHEAFWSAALELLIERPKLPLDMVPAAIDFMHVHRLKLVPQQMRKMTDRGFAAFLSRVRTWMARHPNYGRRPKLRWPKTPIRGFEYVEPKKHEWSVRRWTIRELTDSWQLTSEGNDLHHCVATYALACANRVTSIWSMQCHGSLQSRRVLTIEVAPRTRKIVSALGRCNERPERQVREVMEMWARREGLAMARWV